MVFRIALIVWGLLGTVGAVLALSGNGLPAATLIQGLAVLAVMTGVWLVVKLPWDLYFAARFVQVEQQESHGRSIAVSAAEQAEARQLARRLLALCIALHLIGAGLGLGLTFATEGLLGPLTALAFVLSMGIRPTAAMVHHVRLRLQQLGSRARVPRNDARQLDERLQLLEDERRDRERAAPDERALLLGLQQADEQLTLALRSHESRTLEQLASQRRQHQDDVLTLTREFERSIEKLTSDQALLSGIRAFLAMVRDQPRLG